MTETPTTASGLELARTLLEGDRALHLLGDHRYAAAIAAVTGAASELQRLTAERDALAARLAKVEQAEPVAWVPMHPRFGALWAMTTATPSEERLPSHYPLSPLYASSAPAAAPERAADLGENIIEAQRAQVRALTAERDELAARLAIEYDAEPAEHLYAGDCPDSCQPDARDPACPACCAMVAASQPPAADHPEVELEMVRPTEAGSPEEFATSEDPRCRQGGDACVGCLMIGRCMGDEPARPCRTYGTDGCPDSTACPREGGAA